MLLLLLLWQAGAQEHPEEPRRRRLVLKLQQCDHPQPRKIQEGGREGARRGAICVRAQAYIRHATEPWGQGRPG